LFIAGGFTPPGGIESFIYELAPILASRGHSVSLLCWGPKNPLLDAVAKSGINVHRQEFRWACRISAPDLALLARHGMLEVLRHDVTIFTKIPPLPLLRCLRRLAKRGLRRFIYVTAYRPKEMWPAPGPDPAMLNAFETIVVQAPGFGEELRDYGYRGAVEIIPYIPPKANDVRGFSFDRDKLRLGFLGRLVLQKNVAYLIDVFDHLVAGRTGVCAPPISWELHLFGDGPTKQNLQAAAAERGLTSRIHFHGTVPHHLVGAVIDQCDLFAFSSVSEGQCLAALEILSRGRPIVATAVGAFPEFLTTPELGQLGPLDDAAAFAQTLHEVGSRVQRGDLTPQAVQSRFAKLFPYQEIIDKYCALFA
jgi:glycosyltransferase involved in cell wall biosynthesis